MAYHNPLKVDCPVCRVKAGFRCRNIKDHLMPNCHARRVAKAKKEAV